MRIDAPVAKVIGAAAAVAKIRPGATVAIQGAGGGTGEPTHLLEALRRRFDQEAAPGGLTLLHATGLGDKDRIGADLLAHEGLVSCDIAGHLGMAPRMAALIQQNKVAGYNLPQGVISQLFRATAARQPGILTKVGLGTFVDPRLEGGKLNSRATRDLVRRVDFDGGEWLYYPSIPVDVALVRGTTADLKGNISAEDEAAIYEGISIAQAARASGGIVIAQVKRLAEPGSLDPRDIVIPGVSVDFVVVDPAQRQTVLCEYDPTLCGAVRSPSGGLPRLPFSERKIVARRAAQELFPGAVINVGVGMPDGVAPVAGELGLLETLTFTIEQGLIGGIPAGGIIFGVSHNPEARIHQSHQFDFYDSGSLDLAFLGMAQTDADGDVNVSKVGNLLSGCGGFINISQSAKKVIFCGTFTAKGLRIETERNELRIRREGEVQKFVRAVQQITFSGAFARQRRQPILYVTERAVFELAEDGLLLTEIAPGVDLQRDILGQMEFAPRVASQLRLMPAACFAP